MTTQFKGLKCAYEELSGLTGPYDEMACTGSPFNSDIVRTAKRSFRKLEAGEGAAEIAAHPMAYGKLLSLLTSLVTAAFAVLGTPREWHEWAVQRATVSERAVWWATGR